MTNWLNKSIAVLGLSLMFSLGPALQGFSVAQTASAKDSKSTKSSSAKTSTDTAAPSDSEIADAKTKGMVWVNLSSKIYHIEGKFYGKAKSGRFMSDDGDKNAWND